LAVKADGCRAIRHAARIKGLLIFLIGHMAVDHQKAVKTVS